MLDYAANCGTFWTPGSLRSSFEQTCSVAQLQSGDLLGELLGAEGYLSTEGKICFQFDGLKGKPIFSDVDMRRELMSRFPIKGAGFVETDLDRWESISRSVIAADPDAVATIRAAFVWLDQTIKHAPNAQSWKGRGLASPALNLTPRPGRRAVRHGP